MFCPFVNEMKMKKIISITCGLLLIIIFTGAKKIETVPNLSGMNNLTFLSLGDSYTVGESVLLIESFPYQSVQLLRKEGYNFNSPEIIAKTGWTTDELRNNINDHIFLPSYDFVTLLIGVNNQYRGRPADSYKPEFENLLKRAIQFAGDKADHVIVLSIPDWGVTPFAAGRDRDQIAKEVDEYNSANKTISEQYKVHYIDITPWTREAANDPSLVASDGLHPSAKEYKRWAEKIAGKIKAIIQ